MCGIVGKLNLVELEPISEHLIRQMLGMLYHRGPDEFGFYLEDNVGLGNARLSIIDLEGGQQPITNEDETLWIVLNGEIFNYIELRPLLEERGHNFKTNSDTEILLHLYEEYRPGCLEMINGQFAFAIWDSKNQSLFLARDRLGIRPLFYSEIRGSLVFASEIKAILVDPDVKADVDLLTIDQIFSFWAPLSPRTFFKHIKELPPGHYMSVCDGSIKINEYWRMTFPHDRESPSCDSSFRDYERIAHDRKELIDHFANLLIDACRIRLRSDVPVGAYLSGGLDSAIIAAIVKNFSNNRLDSFSISFNDKSFDESEAQKKMAHFLNTEHQSLAIDYDDIGFFLPRCDLAY